MSLPVVGVVIVNHNLRESLRQTLESLRKVNYPGLLVVVSDNASTDGAPEMVRALFPEVHLLAHPEQQGYARAANLGLEYLADKAKYIFNSTNDMTFDPQIMNVLVDYAEKNPQAGVLGTKFYFHDRPDIVWHAGGAIPWWHGHSKHYGWLRQDHPRYDKIRECDFVTGCGCLLRSDTLKQVGFFKEDFVFNCEDSELCYRVRAAGYRIIYVPQAKMWHKTGTTLAKNRPLQLYYHTRNNLYLLQRHRVGIYPLTLWSHLLLVTPFKMLVFLLMGNWQNAAGIYQGARDWWRGRSGWFAQSKPAAVMAEKPARVAVI